MSSQAIEFDPCEASPFVRVIASLLGFALRDDGLAAKAARAKGTLVLRSPAGNPTATLVFSPETITLSNGNTGGADIVVTADFERPESSPTIDGVFAHPIFGYLVLPLLNVKLPHWRQSAGTFWQLAEGQPAMPKQLTITCTDDNQSVSYSCSDTVEDHGEYVDADDSAEILANRATLERLLVGHAILVSEAIAGRVKFRGNVKQMAGISQMCQKLLLGELGVE